MNFTRTQIFLTAALALAGALASEAERYDAKPPSETKAVFFLPLHISCPVS